MKISLCYFVKYLYAVILRPQKSQGAEIALGLYTTAEALRFHNSSNIFGYDRSLNFDCLMIEQRKI